MGYLVPGGQDGKTGLLVDDIGRVGGQWVCQVSASSPSSIMERRK